MIKTLFKLRSAETAGKILLLAVLYFVTGKIGLLLALPPGYATFIWPPSGISIGMLILHGWRMWPGVLIGSFFLNSAVAGASFMELDFSHDQVLIAAGIAIGSTVQALVGTYLVSKIIGLPLVLSNVRQTLLLFSLTGPFACLIAATIGTATLYHSGHLPLDKVSYTWATWWAGDMLGVFVFMPLMLIGPGSRNLLKWRGHTVQTLPVIAMVILIMPLGLTFYMWKLTSEYVYEKNQSHFDVLVQESEKALTSRMDAYRQSLIASAGLFTILDHVGRQDWSTYVRSLDLSHNYPGVYGIGYIRDIEPANLQKELKEIRKDNAPEFKIFPPEPAEDMFVVIYIEPLRENSMALGFNIAHEQNRYEAALLSRDSGHAAITHRVILRQQNFKNQGFLLLHPMYYPGKPLETVEQRRAAFRGWIYAPFVGKDFLNGLTQSQGEKLHLRVYDGKEKSDGSLIFSSTALPQDRAHFTTTRTMNIMQRDWTLVWTSTPDFEKSIQSNEPMIIMIGGLLLTGMFGAFLSMLTYRAQIVNALVDKKTKEISANEERLRLLIRRTPAAVAMFDRDMKYIMASDRWVEDYQLPDEDLVGKSHYDVFPEIKHIPKWRDLHRRVLSGEIIRNDNDSWTRMDGRVDWVRYEIHPWRNADQEIGGIVMFNDVITARKEMEDALKTSEETFRSAMEHASIGKALLNLFGQWIKVNKALCELLGYSEEELLKIDFQSITHPDDLTADLENLEKLVRGKIETYQMEKRYIHKDGHIIWGLLSVSLGRDMDGQPKYFISQIQDITERREMERIKSEFISIISHELRTPLTSIHGSLGLIQGAMAKDLPEQVARLISLAYRNSERLILLISDILDLDKIASGHMAYTLREEDLSSLVTQAVQENRPYGDKYGVEFVIDALPENVKVQVDAHRLAQVMSNLLSNAAKFSPAGKSVHISVTQTNGMARVYIADQGRGIPSEFRARIFRKFSQADSSVTRASEGSGLGLHISKEIVQKMGGGIGFTSQEGKGTTFWFEFPSQS